MAELPGSAAVLFVAFESAQEDAARAELERHGQIASSRAATLAEVEGALAGVDLVLLGEAAGAPDEAELSALIARSESDAPLLAVRQFDPARDESAAPAVDADRLAHLWPAARRALQARDDRRRLRLADGGLRRLLEHAHDGIWVHRGGRVVWANARMAALLGFGAPEEMLGTSVLDHVFPDDRAKVLERMQAMRGGQSAVNLGLTEARALRRDGSEASFEVSALPIEFEGTPASLAIARDVSERKLLQARLLQSDRLAAVGKLASGVAHEINNPLSYVIANLGLIAAEIPSLESGLRALHDAADDPGKGRLAALSQRLDEIGASLADATEGAERVRLIVRDLRTFAHRDDGGRGGPTDLHRVVETALKMAASEIRRRARVVEELGPTPPVEAAEDKVAQVVLNLLLNAAEGLDEGAEDNEIHVATSTDERGRAVLTVKDSGERIPPERMAHVFDPFNPGRRGGAGLGLSISHAIVEQLGGDLTAASDASGVTFRVALPKAKSATLVA
jgi:PAS domain S-box-containing protein